MKLTLCVQMKLTLRLIRFDTVDYLGCFCRNQGTRSLASGMYCMWCFRMHRPWIKLFAHYLVKAFCQLHWHSHLPPPTPQFGLGPGMGSVQNLWVVLGGGWVAENVQRFKGLESTRSFCLSTRLFYQKMSMCPLIAESWLCHCLVVYDF